MLEKLPEVVGHALQGQRAGLDKIAFNKVSMRAGKGHVTLASLAFIDHGPIPPLYTADGPGVSPPLQWIGVPEAATSVVLIVEDADAPVPQPLVHAIAVELSGGDGALREGALNPSEEGTPEVKTGRHSFLQTGWLPPDPPPGHGLHRYAFQVFALGPGAQFSDTPGREELLDAIEAFGLASGLLIGTYERRDGSIKLEATASVPSGAPLAGEVVL